MLRYRRARIPWAADFFTVNAYRRQRLVTDTELLHTLRKALQWVRTEHPFRIDAQVVLTDYLHTAWTLPRLTSALKPSNPLRRSGSAP